MIRNLTQVLDEVKAEVPRFYPYRYELKRELLKIQLEASRTLPTDGHQRLWEKAAVVLREHIGEPDDLWKKRALAIFLKSDGKTVRKPS